MATTRWGAAVDGLVALLRAQAGFRSPDEDSTDRPVYDGPEWQLHRDRLTSYVVVGWSADADDAAGSTDQEPATMGTARARDEEGVIRCLAAGYTGDSEFGAPKTARDLALAVLADVEAALTANPTVGIGGAKHLVVELAGIRAPRQYLDEGLVCELEFDITYSTRL